MQPERELFNLNLNLGLLLRGPASELQALLDSIARFTVAHPEVRLIFKDVTGDPLRIQRQGGRP